jgi:hypothetical protein
MVEYLAKYERMWQMLSGKQAYTSVESQPLTSLAGRDHNQRDAIVRQDHTIINMLISWQQISQATRSRHALAPAGKSWKKSLTPKPERRERLRHLLSQASTHARTLLRDTELWVAN